MRFAGTLIRRANSAALMPSASRSSRNVSPGWMGPRMSCILSMVVDDFHFGRPGIALGSLQTDPPLVVDADAQLPPAPTHARFEPVSANVSESGPCEG